MLYKYRSLCSERNENEDSTELERVKGIIVDNVIWFPYRNTLNDPFDCFPVLCSNGTDKEKYEFCKRAINQAYPGSSDGDKQGLINHFYQNADIEQLLDDCGMLKKFDQFSIFSLSEDKENLLMWSHYANNHSGVCLGFKDLVLTGEQPLPVFRSKKVIYSEQRYSINWLLEKEERKDKIMESLIRKLEPWSYEKEHRIILPGMGGLVKYSAECLEEIIFGNDSDAEVVREVSRWAKAREKQPKLYKARLHKTEGKIIIEPLL